MMFDNILIEIKSNLFPGWCFVFLVLYANRVINLLFFFFGHYLILIDLFLIPKHLSFVLSCFLLLDCLIHLSLLDYIEILHLHAILFCLVQLLPFSSCFFR